MAHTHPTRKPGSSDLVLLRFAVPSKMATVTSTEVIVRTCAGGVIRIPKTLKKEHSNSEVIALEARVPRDLASAVRSIYSELFRMVGLENR